LAQVRTGLPESGPGDAAPPRHSYLALQRRQERFAWAVISHALNGSARRNRAVTTQFFILIVAQAVIYATMLDKPKNHSIVDWVPIFAASILAILGIALSIFDREGPMPPNSTAQASAGPDDVWTQYIKKCASAANFNKTLRFVKIILLGVAFALTVVPLVITSLANPSG
jgi:hypothetical protein